jgi:hypothetical protein
VQSRYPYAVPRLGPSQNPEVPLSRRLGRAAHEGVTLLSRSGRQPRNGVVDSPIVTVLSPLLRRARHPEVVGRTGDQ